MALLLPCFESLQGSPRRLLQLFMAGRMHSLQLGAVGIMPSSSCTMQMAQGAVAAGAAAEGDERLLWEGAATWLMRQHSLYRQQKLTLRRLHLLKSVLGERLGSVSGHCRLASAIMGQG